MEKELIVLLDSGDTLIDESTQILDEGGIVLSAKWIEGAPELLDFLRAEHYRVCLVADGELESFDNVYAASGKRDVFEGWVISEAVGVQKPDAAVFDAAFRAMQLSNEDKRRVIMIGNHLRKDIAGANRYGIRSLWMRWSPRYEQNMDQPDWRPTYTAENPREVMEIIQTIESGLKGSI